MGFFRFRRRIKILRGVRWNIGKNSTSLSLGGKGLTYTIGTKGSRTTVGIPGTGLSYTQVHHHSTAPPGSPPPQGPTTPPSPSGGTTPPPLPSRTVPPPVPGRAVSPTAPSGIVSPPLSTGSVSTQPAQTSKRSRTFYVLGFICLGIWLLTKFSEQQPGRSTGTTFVTPSTPSGTTSAANRSQPGSWNPSASISALPSYLSRTRQRSVVNNSVYLTPSPSETIVRRALPVSAAELAAPSPFSLAEATPIPTTPTPMTYHIVNVSSRDSLNLRSGPGDTFRPVGRIRPTARGIVPGNGRYEHGGTVWRQISIDGYSGWVNEIFLKPDTQTP
jgi:Protein of unknown function (DUF4236)